MSAGSKACLRATVYERYAIAPAPATPSSCREPGFAGSFDQEHLLEWEKEESGAIPHHRCKATRDTFRFIVLALQSNLTFYFGSSGSSFTGHCMCFMSGYRHGHMLCSLLILAAPAARRARVVTTALRSPALLLTSGGSSARAPP